jgi:hypothetical protein
LRRRGSACRLFTAGGRGGVQLMRRRRRAGSLRAGAARNRGPAAPPARRCPSGRTLNPVRARGAPRDQELVRVPRRLSPENAFERLGQWNQQREHGDRNENADRRERERLPVARWHSDACQNTRRQHRPAQEQRRDEDEDERQNEKGRLADGQRERHGDRKRKTREQREPVGVPGSACGRMRFRLLQRLPAQFQTQEGGVLPLDPVDLPGASEEVAAVPLDRAQALGGDLEFSGGLGERKPSLQATPAQRLAKLGQFSPRGARSWRLRV